MSNFNKFSSQVSANTAAILKEPRERLFSMDVTGDEVYAAYLAAFPAGTNPMLKERTSHDCSTCRNFIKNIGSLVLVQENGSIVSVWDNIKTGDEYEVVAAALSNLVKSKNIKSRFLVTERSYGAEYNFGLDCTKWHHFVAKIPNNLQARNVASNYVGMANEDFAILRRSILEITDESVDIVLELIDQNSIYRGAEHRVTVQTLQNLKRQYNALKTERKKELFLWINAKPQNRIRNTVIGTLLTDLSEGMELEVAVKRFEDKVAPTNYKRPKALVTQKMIDAAKKEVEDLGIEESLHRRYAKASDVSVNNVLFVNRDVRPVMIGSVFDNVQPTATKSKELKGETLMHVKDFVEKVLPTAHSIEAFVESNKINNFVSLIAPVFEDSNPILKWDNNFTWSYVGEVTDSIKERVKSAGGKVDGYLRVSLSWHNADDLDLAVNRNNSETLYFGNKRAFGATLDVDMNAFGLKDEKAPVENIVWPTKSSLKDGVYEIQVHNFNKRKTSDVGFEVEVEIDGDIYTFDHPEDLCSGKRKTIGKITVKNGVVTVDGLTLGKTSKEVWGITTNQWVPVDMVMYSPNFWDEQTVGNQHMFFMLKGCKNPESTRGFYNEFLRESLNTHRKVFELLASKMKAEYSEDQLSGIGISSTKKNDSITLRVKGAVNRIIKVVF